MSSTLGSSGNSTLTGVEEAYHHENDEQQISNVLSSTTRSSSSTDGSSSGHHDADQQPPPNKKIRKLPGNPDPSAEVIALSPKTLMATNRFVCEICKKGFQREQNLQLHKRGHNLPWKLKQRTSSSDDHDQIVKKRVYICPEASCIHHNPARALGDLTGIKKHYYRKHGEKKWKCEKCSKKYAVQADWKAHSKTCGSKEYKCDCGTIFSRRDSFVTHRAFCDALTEENNKVNQGLASNMLMNNSDILKTPLNPSPYDQLNSTAPKALDNIARNMFPISSGFSSSSLFASSSSSSSGFDHQLGTNMSATALLQKAAQMGTSHASSSSSMNSPLYNMAQKGFVHNSLFNGMAILPQNVQVPTQIDRLVDGFFATSLQNGTQETMVSELLYANSNSTDNHDQKISMMQNGDHWFSGLYSTGNQRLLNTSNLTEINGGSSSTGNHDSLTVDFLGIGGITQRNFHEMQQDMESMDNTEFKDQ